MNKILLTISILVACTINISGQELYNFYFKSVENIHYQQDKEHKVKAISEFIINENKIYLNSKLIKHGVLEENYYKDNLVLTTDVYNEEFNLFS